MTLLYRVEIQHPGREPVAVLVKPAPALRLFRRLLACGVPFTYGQVDTRLVSAREVEDMIDELERNKKEPA